MDWLKHGDRDTKFFHLSTIVLRWKNKIVAIKDEKREWIHEHEAVKTQIVNYFAKLFTEDGIYNVPQDVFPELHQRDWNYLSLPYNKTDVDTVVKQMGNLRAPGPDGF